MKDKQITIAKTSEFAKTKKKSIIESLEKNLVFKKELVPDTEKNNFENEQDNFKNLEGKSKKDNIQEKPLSGAGKTSNIVNNPLYLNLKPNENSISQDPHAQKTKTSKSSSQWKGKNEYQKKNENGELAAPVDNVINPGAELSIEAKNAHSTFYKNHNKAETFEPKDFGHSITKDGVGGNLKGITDPKKASSAAGGSDLGGKTSTEKIKKHMSSPNGYSEKIAKEKKAGDFAGKTSTEKLPSHLSSPDSKKNRPATTEIDAINNELNGDTEDRKFEKQLASLKLRKEKLENYKKDKVKPAANDKAFDDKIIDNVSKLPLPKAKSKQSGELIDNEISGKIIPFTEKQKYALTESLGMETKEIENSIRSAVVTSILVQDSIKVHCTLDDFFEQTIIFETVQTGIVKSKDIVLDLNFNYMDKTTSFVFKGKVVEVETHGSSNYIIIEISSQNASDFYAFMKLYNTRQENINFFLNAAKG